MALHCCCSLHVRPPSSDQSSMICGSLPCPTVNPTPDSTSSSKRDMNTRFLSAKSGVADEEPVVGVDRAVTPPSNERIIVGIPALPLMPQSRGNVINPSGRTRGKGQREELMALIRIAEGEGIGD